MASNGSNTQIGAHQLNFCKSADEIKKSLQELMANYEAEIQDIVNSAGKGVNPLHRLADADGRAALYSAELTLPALVSGDKKIREVSADAKVQL